MRPHGPRFLSLLTLSLGFLTAGASAQETQQAPPASAEPDASPKEDAAILAMRTFIANASIDKTAADWNTHLPAPPKLEFSAGKQYFWVLETSVGTMKVQLLQDIAPMHASTTIYLSEVGFYDGLMFHRVINRFMAQGGDPLGSGIGGPGFKIAGEVSPLARHDSAGVLSAANTGKGTPEGSQFFLTFGPTPHLDGVHTVYGHVVEGLETLRKLELVGTPNGKPRALVTIDRATIEVVDDPTAAMEDDHDSDDAAIAGLRQFISEQEAAGTIDHSADKWKTKLPKPPQQSFGADNTYLWNLMTNKGAIQVELLPASAPMHVSSTIYLTLAGFYDGLSFHRVIPGFMAQGGCPLGTGTGFPGFQMNRELDPALAHSGKGILSAANLGRDGTDGSQFFLTFAPAPHLDGGYTIYGKVVVGLDVLSELERCGTRSGGTTMPLQILKATITLK